MDFIAWPLNICWFWKYHIVFWMKNIWTWLLFCTGVWCWAINGCRIKPLDKTVQMENCRICTRSSKKMSQLLALSSPLLKIGLEMELGWSVRSVTCPYSTWCHTVLSWAYPGLREDPGSCKWLLSVKESWRHLSWKLKREVMKTNNSSSLIFFYSVKNCYWFSEWKAQKYL